MLTKCKNITSGAFIKGTKIARIATKIINKLYWMINFTKGYNHNIAKPKTNKIVVDTKTATKWIRMNGSKSISIGLLSEYSTNKNNNTNK